MEAPRKSRRLPGRDPRFPVPGEPPGLGPQEPSARTPGTAPHDQRTQEAHQPARRPRRPRSSAKAKKTKKVNRAKKTKEAKEANAPGVGPLAPPRLPGWQGARLG